MLNMVTIHAIRKTSPLPRTLKTLLLSLAVSDVGLLIQPFAISLLVKGLQQNNIACSRYKVFEILLVLFSTPSFYGVIPISVDKGLVSWCGQVPNYPASSSHADQELDSQACCCRGDLNMGVECICFFNGVVNSV